MDPDSPAGRTTVSSQGPDDGARETLISEEDFAEELVDAVREFVSNGNDLHVADPSRWPKRRFHLLLEKADALETFLDDHDARHNRRYCTLAELIASVKGFAAVGHLLHHIRVRLPKYRVRLQVPDLESFQTDLRAAQEFVNRSLATLISEVASELEDLGVGCPEPAAPIAGASQEPIRRHLPHDLEESEGNTDEAKVAAVLSRFIEVVSRFERAERMRPEDREADLDRFVREVYDETQARGVESAIHNIQSAYDTHVKFTVIEARNPDLRVFRGHISLALHLLEVGTLLVHFVERHENVIQHRVARERIVRIVDQAEVLRQAVFFALFSASRILHSIRGLVTDLLARFTQRGKLELEIPDGGILHARPLSLIVSIVRHHGTAVDMVVGEDRTSANSIMGLIMLVGRHAGLRKVGFRGDARPLRDIQLLFESGLGEDGMDKLPAELDYLR